MAVPLVSTAALLPQIAPFAPTCPAFVAEQQIRMAAIELAEVSRSWRHVTTISAVAEDETLVAPPFTAIHEIEFAEFDGQPLTPVQFSTFDHGGQGKPKHISQKSPGGVCLSPFMPGSLRISMFLKPRADNAMGGNPDKPFEDAHNVIPDFFVWLHGSTLAAGALARIFAIPDEPWTDEGRAAFYNNEFIRKRDSTFRANIRGQQRAKLRTPFRDM
ncbi:MAG: hypothetical protein MEQ74_11885 [Paracoccus sp.]|nr:hypothetical protein [Paracoccus sp. (in: a-proteobacteria)]